MHKPIVDVHIEKTAGTSLRNVLINSYGDNRVLHYDCSLDKLILARDRLIVTENTWQRHIQNQAKRGWLFPIIKAGYFAVWAAEARRGFSPESIPDGFDVITGHLTGARLVDIVPPEESLYTTVLRAPLERTASHYAHWRRTRGLARFRVVPPYDPAMSFESFALLPEMANYQTRAIAINPDRFHLIGVTTYLQEFAEELGLQTGVGGMPRLNRACSDKPTNHDPDFVARFQAQNQEDYALFEATCRKWGALPLSFC